jgi:hypothetical protein
MIEFPVSLAFGLAVEAMGSRDAVLRWFRPTRFLRPDVSWLLDTYTDEPRITDALPYKELARWTGAPEQSAPELEIQKASKEFILGSDPVELKAFQVEALQAFRNEGRMSRNDSIVRLMDVGDDAKTLRIQRALYSDQVQSNLVMDWEGPHSLASRLKIQTLRSFFQAQLHRRLPPLEDTRLANTIGISVVLLFRSEEGALTPYIPLRTQSGMLRKGNRLALMEGTYTSTASGALRWRDDASTFQELVVADLLEELNQEVGIRAEDVSGLHPAGLCREFLRGGKPQLFFVGLTSLTEEELIERRRDARQREATEDSRKVEVEDTHLNLSDPKIAKRQLRKHGMNPEAAANLFYARLRFEPEMTK